LFGDPLDRNVINVHLIAFDEIEQQIEWAFKDLKLDLVVFHWALAASVSAFHGLALELRAVFVVIFFAGLHLADLTRKFVHYLVDRDVEIGFGIFGMKIWAGECNVHFDVKGFFAVVVVQKDDVRGDQGFPMTFQMADFFGDEFIDGASEGQVSRCDV
jgi:hypothetical protein